MSSRRSRSRQSSGGASSRITDDQIADLVTKLQQLIPELRRRRSDKVSASKVLQETCNYIRNLHREVDDLSDRLSELLESTDSDSAQAAIIRSLLIFTSSTKTDKISFQIADSFKISSLIYPVDMNPGGYTAEVTSLSPIATEKDVHNFFAFCGEIDHIDIVRGGEYACTAYVTFKSPHALETAVLLSGATILDQCVCITHWGHYDDDYDPWNQSAWTHGDESASTSSEGHQFVSSPGEAITLAQDVVKTMLAKGYVLGKDALSQAKAFDESHQVSATAAAKVAEFSEKIGLTDKICVGVEAVKSVDERYHVTDVTKSAVSATGRTAAAAANAVINSSYFSKGAFWLSGALSRAAQAAADLGSRGENK
ncbi:hypothetical protein ACH5RR_035840 [Cinchona calisaya]|uniref:BHLH domain-containing protein n=1 Tax=Cinchona calisaya TaxID=153742 RepID=A0ABD2Y2Y5_9GENT